MPRQPAPSVIGTRPFRELSGPEMAAANVQDIIDRLDRMIHDPLFRERAEEMFIKSGRFGPGACYPVVEVKGVLGFKVYTSLEAYRSKEKLPAPFEVPVDLKVGEHGDDPQGLLSGNIKVNREIGVSVETAVDKVRLDAGLEVLAPARNESGYVENKEAPESQSNPRSRKAKARKGEESNGGIGDDPKDDSEEKAATIRR
jgi:hypothetical protein